MLYNQTITHCNENPPTLPFFIPGLAIQHLFLTKKKKAKNRPIRGRLCQLN